LANTHEKEAGCEFLTTCDFFVTIMASVPQFATKMQEKYCLVGFQACARHAYAEQHGTGSIPEDLFPNASSF